MDFRGHGKSGHTPGSYLLRDYLMDTVAFIKGRIEEPAVIFGHSLGGMIAVMMAVYHPESVRAIIIGDAPLSRQALRNCTQGLTTAS